MEDVRGWEQCSTRRSVTASSKERNEGRQEGWLHQARAQSTELSNTRDQETKVVVGREKPRRAL